MSDKNTALVVGGGTGIGFATAERLTRRGVSVALAGRREAVLQVAKARLVEANPDAEVVTVAGDAGDEAAARAIVATAVERLGRLDACINCAGIYEPIHLLKMDAGGWRRTLAATLDSIVYISVAAANEMVKTGGGRFVLLSSINAPLSEPDSAHYSAAKAGVSSLVRSIAVDLASSNIVANAVAPGWVHTDMVDDFVKNATRETLSRLNPLGRVGRPDELATVIEFLALDAPLYLNGATIFVDGGQTAMAPLI
jgi:NAD(P)-dependent dehydrogenase (short-subunit alcohol dehydrogenase family)